MTKVCIFNKSNDVSRFDIFKSSSEYPLISRYLWRAAPKQAQSINTHVHIQCGR